MTGTEISHSNDQIETNVETISTTLLKRPPTPARPMLPKESSSALTFMQPTEGAAQAQEMHVGDMLGSVIFL